MGIVREGAKRILRTERANRKEPLPLEVLKAIVDGSDLSDCLVLRNGCLFLWCFTGFLRFDDVSRIRRNQILFHEGFMKIKIDKSKNDQLREGNEVSISEAEGSVCPVKILKEYLLRMNISPRCSELIFRQLVKTKASHKLAARDKPICYSTFRDHLCKTFGNSVPDPTIYGTHSFRSGGASKAANSDVKERPFQRHGRWKLVSAKDGYVKDDISVRLSVSKSLGL